MTSILAPSAATAAVNSHSVAASTTASTTSSSGSGASISQTDFLKLLTAQLQYQSPTNPADPTQLASEFAAISTVQGINSLNSKVAAISTSTGAAQMAQAASLVGKKVAVTGDVLTTNAAGSAQGAFVLAAPASSTTVTVLNQNGSLAGTLSLGALPAGQNQFTWTGGTAGSKYLYDVTANSASSGAVSVTPYSVYTVNGVNLSGSAPTLNVAGTASTVPVSSIQTVLD
ncbi:flagellar hook assembly protein FlgD [Acidocella sp.]|uniref:flagellar hook assembly protein FlgD n=1 Tax=Acidocella sp. TaxID=50710 RepID=UPI00261FC754|nr:flagellar hook capping FlgD N-terminal domain-containing protein [Acidocella sp.]